MSLLMRSEVLNDVMAEFCEKRKQEMDGKYVDMLNRLMANVRGLMANRKNVEVSFTVTTGKLKGGDKDQIDVNIMYRAHHGRGGPRRRGERQVVPARAGQHGGRRRRQLQGAGIELYNIRVVMFGKASPLSPFQFIMKDNGGEWLQSGKGKITAVKKLFLKARAFSKKNDDPRADAAALVEAGGARRDSEHHEQIRRVRKGAGADSRGAGDEEDDKTQLLTQLND